ncbi:hypothetical protein M3Y98_00679100 [Aphelenchoides besseyi]|nr:hypothetical protein M3Y98_00679100 [Aphelenchoides besseyi]KAI6209109.1 hypothetical protein M3Y96_00186000 [Aphelenchoides besseyi]
MSSMQALNFLFLLLILAFHRSTANTTTAKPTFNHFDYVPLIIEAVFICVFAIAMGIVEFLIRAEILAKEDARGPTKIHLQHLQEYKEQEIKFLESGGQANLVRTPRSNKSTAPAVAIVQPEMVEVAA